MPTLRKHVSDALLARGYRRLERSVHLLRLDDDFSFWVNTGVVGLATDIAPYVGLRSDAIERARAECMALPDYPTTVTVGANAGYILGRPYAAWLPGANPEEIVGVILEALATLRPFASLSTLARTFSIKGIGGSPGTPYVAVIAALLTHDHAGVQAQLASARGVFCLRADPVCEQFQAFEARVLSRLHPVA